MLSICLLHVVRLIIQIYLFFQSSENPDKVPVRAPAPFDKTLCLVVPYIEIKGCVEVHSRNAAFIRNDPLFYIIGKHSARATVARGILTGIITFMKLKDFQIK